MDNNNFRELFIRETGQQYYDWHGFKLEYVEWLEKKLSKADKTHLEIRQG